MKGDVVLGFTLDGRRSRVIRDVLELEIGSAPPGGEVSIELIEEGGEDRIIIRMSSSDMSTCRAMLNSYLGLLTAALDAAGS
ncbi:MAG: KEOPS complex subunit Pcc1 [Thermoplasmatota archaeon]